MSTPPIAEAKLMPEKYIQLRYFQEDVTLNSEEVSIGWKKAAELDPMRKHAVCIITAPYSLLNESAIQFVMKETANWPKIAVVVHNLAQKLTGNFILQLSLKSKKMKLFDDAEKAQKWLLQS